MQNLRKKLNNIVTLLLIVTLAGCSFCKPKLSYPACPTVSLNRQVTEAVFSAELGKSPAIYVRINESSSKVKKALTCFLSQEYTNIKEKDRKGITLVIFHIQDKGILVAYAFDFELDVLVEIQFIPVDDSNYLMSVLSSYSLTNIMKSIADPTKPRLIIPLDEKMGIISKQDALVLFSKLTNGLFLK